MTSLGYPVVLRKLAGNFFQIIFWGLIVPIYQRARARVGHDRVYVK